MIPKADEFHLPVLRTFGNGREWFGQDVCSNVIRIMRFTEEDLNTMTKEGSKTQISDRCYWAMFHLKEFGLLFTPRRGYYQITPAGLDLLNRFKLPCLTVQYLEEHYRMLKNGTSTTSKNSQVNHNVEEQNPSSEKSCILEIHNFQNLTLEDVNAQIRLLQKMGNKIPDEFLKWQSTLENRLLENLLPKLKEIVFPELSQIENRVTIALDYDPNEDLKIRIVRR